MSDVVVKREPDPSVDPTDEEEKSINTPVSVSSRVVADGLIMRNGQQFARMTLVPRPTTQPLTIGSKRIRITQL